MGCSCLRAMLLCGFMIAAGPAQANTYYWDNNGSTAGFGTAGGTWGNPASEWTTNAAGSSVPGSVTTGTDDTLNFGNGTNGLAAGTITVSGTVDAGNMTISSGSGGIILTNGTINLSSSVTITIGNAAPNRIYSILSGADTSLIKAGTGRLKLSAANAFTGMIYVNAGTLEATDMLNSSLGPNGSVQVTVNTNGILLLERNDITGTLIMNGGTLNSGNSFPSSWTGSIVLQSNSNINGANLNRLDFNGVISGPGGLTFSSSNGRKSYLKAANTYTGNTINGANSLLQLDDSLALQNSALDTASSMVGDAAYGLKTTMTALTLGGLIGDKDFAYIFTTTGGYSSVTSLTLNPGADVTNSYSGCISDGAAGMNLIKTGAGMQRLFGINTYSGATTIRDGVLMGFVGGSCSNSAIIVTNTPGNISALGVSVTNSAMQWTCASMTFKTNSQLQFKFSVTPGTSIAPLKILVNLTFDNIPTVVLDAPDILPGIYPLIEVGVTVPEHIPNLDAPFLGSNGLQGRLTWSGKTLSLHVAGTGTLISIR